MCRMSVRGEFHGDGLIPVYSRLTNESGQDRCLASAIRETYVQLESFSIKGFRSIACVEDIQMGSPTLLTGHNDAGKSALLDAIRFLLDAYAFTDRDPTYEIAKDSDQEKTDIVKTRVPSTSVVGTFSVSAAEQEALFLPPRVRVRRTVALGGSPTYDVERDIPEEELLRDLDILGVSDLRDRIKSLDLKPNGTNKPELLASLRQAAAVATSSPGWATAGTDVIKALPSLLSFNPSGVTDAEESIRSALQTAYKVHEQETKFRESIRKLEEELEEKVAEDASDLKKHIKDTISDIGDVQIIPFVSLSSGLKNTRISITNAAGEDIQLGEAGAGRARRVSLAVWEFNTGLLSQSGDIVILYDEPDTHLDYTHQRNFMQLLRRQTELPNVRMAVATHSMNLIDGVDISDVVLLKHNEQFRTTAHKLVDNSEVGSHLGAVAASLGLRNTVLLHERLFVGVEGATEAAAFPVLFRLATGRQLEACGIAMWSCDNNEGALKFAAFLNSHGRDVVFVVDQDSKKNSKHLFNTKKLAEYGLNEKHHGLYLGHPNELEDLFDDSAWVAVANKHWPHVDGRMWVDNDVTDLRNGKFSSDLLELMKSKSESGPRNKQELMTTLVLELQGPSEVPESLLEAFTILIERAA